jgi:hypothetical protein
MARCDEGYLCTVCGQDVSTIAESALYLRFLLDEVPLEHLSREAEAHIACCPERAQYIVDASFAPVNCPGPFAKEGLDPEFVSAEEIRVTAAWQQLQTLPRLSPQTEEPNRSS